METICVFGASIVWGAYDSEKGGWVNRLRLFLGDKADVYNLGISGDTTNDLLERFDAEAKARQPTIVIFSIGTNDSIYNAQTGKQLVPLEEFGKNMQKLVDKAKKFTKKVVLMGCMSVDESRTRPIPWVKSYHYINQTLMQYDRKIKEVAEKNNVQYLPVSGLLQNDELEDGLHPNAKGHEKIFAKVKEFLIENKIV